MSTTDSDTDYQSSTTDNESYEGNEYEETMPSQVPPPAVGPNKIHELVQDNIELRNFMSKMSNQLKEKHAQLDAFYKKVKDSSKTMIAAYAQAQTTIQDQQKTIAFLQSEKVQLKREIMSSSPRCVAANEHQDTNGNEKAEEDYKVELNNTVAMLTHQLRISQENYHQLEKKNLENEAFLKQKWMDREKEITKWSQQQTGLHERLQAENENLCFTLQEKQKEFEQQEQIYKQQFMLLSGEIDKYKKELKMCENQQAKSKSLIQSKEERIYQLSKDTKVMEEQVKKMTDEIIYLKQTLEDHQRHCSEKEESLDQLFKVYTEEREHREGFEAKKKKLTEELDKVLAQYLCAEESLKRKNEEIRELNNRLRDADTGPQVSMFKQLAECYKKDFEKEFAEKQRAQQECESLKTMVGQYNNEMHRMKQELMKYQHQQFQPRTGYGT